MCLMANSLILFLKSESFVGLNFVKRFWFKAGAFLCSHPYNFIGANSYVLLHRFLLLESPRTCSSVTNNFLELDQEMLMMDNYLIFLGTLASVRSLIGMPDADLVQSEMSTLLCMGDKTNSLLM